MHGSKEIKHELNFKHFSQQIKQAINRYPHWVDV